jgi:hypothetical protein
MVVTQIFYMPRRFEPHFYMPRCFVFHNTLKYSEFKNFTPPLEGARLVVLFVILQKVNYSQLPQGAS